MKHNEMRMAVSYLQIKGFKFDFQKAIAVKNDLILAMQAIEFKTFEELDKYVFLADHGFTYSPDQKAFHMHDMFMFSQDFVEERKLYHLKLAYTGMIGMVTPQ